MSQEDIQHLQTVDKAAQAERSKFILKDDHATVWEHLKNLKDARVDFVLDNCKYGPYHSVKRYSESDAAGFELFTDLVFADYLVTHTPYVSSVVFQYANAVYSSSLIICPY